MYKKRSYKNKQEWKYIVNNKLKNFGEIDFEKKSIKINKSKKKNKNPGEIIDTIVHEEIHRNHPQMYEKNVKKRLAKILKNMSQKQKNKLYNLYS